MLNLLLAALVDAAGSHQDSAILDDDAEALTFSQAVPLGELLVDQLEDLPRPHFEAVPRWSRRVVQGPVHPQECGGLRVVRISPEVVHILWSTTFRDQPGQRTLLTRRAWTSSSAWTWSVWPVTGQPRWRS
ncbi:hypothetical protein [Pseudarthrobacter sp. AB1]|uniref:hypothetical protein n=1 Tax=Pseudarthrobacter sp. AB1 TaxID=2138309 RepID=UPI0028158112|nr:hypothetical protein [Pseudarthrobacter sp. AB1]